MVDPLTAFAAIKAAVSAGQELVNVTKQIGEFFDGVDDLRNKHNKKKSSAFSGEDENAMETFVALQKAKDAEEELRELIIHLRGYSAWQDLIAIRARVRREKKEREEEQARLKAERFESLVIWGSVGLILTLVSGFAIVVLLGVTGRI
jgi:hypothetical protein|tara:strand:+ start:271 stop:714 length:444 start_codon:yes stop_codon:yes gene_type:complete